MTTKSWGIHACWLDRHCRKWRTPAFTYINLYWITIRINPAYTRHTRWGEPHWSWDVLQVWRNTDPKRKGAVTDGKQTDSDNR